MISQEDHEYLAISSLEWKLTSTMGFGLTTASSIQRAVCRVADGYALGQLGEEAAVIRAIGDVSALVGTKPKEIGFLSGIRTGKSLFASAIGYHWSQVCDVSRLGPGEIPRVSIVSLKRDTASVVHQHLVGRVLESPLMRETVLEEPSAESLLVRHPSGRPVEICVVAGSRAGASLVARWSAGCIFDEFGRMLGAESGAVVNWDHEKKAVALRMLAGAQICNISSPWAPYGPAYEMVTTHWKRPSRTIVVIKAPAYEVNPEHWTEERVAEARETNPEAFVTDVMAEFATQEESLFSADALDSSMQDWAERGPEEGHTYAAAMDPATRGNGWSLVVTTRHGAKKSIVLAREWKGTKSDPLSPRAVLEAIAEVLAPYAVHSIESDQYYADALVDVGKEFGLSVVTTKLTDKEITARYLALKIRLENGEIELPNHEQLRTDLLRIQKRVNQNGISIVLPHTQDGRHCDFAPAVMLGLSRYLSDVVPEKPRQRDAETERMIAYAKRRFGKRDTFDPPWRGAA